jgi:hypothetical protein
MLEGKVVKDVVNRENVRKSMREAWWRFKALKV